MSLRVLVTSDIHLEFGDCDIPNPHDADVLILGGDIMMAQDLHDHPPSRDLDQARDTNRLGTRQKMALRFRDFLRRCSERFEHVVYVAGNHEFYHGRWVESLEDLRNECGRFPNIHFLERDSVTIDGVLFVGSTLWTDMNRRDPLTLHGIVGMMNDFQIIRNDSKGFRRLSAMDTVDRHHQSLDYIRETLAKNPNTPTVIVGHHAPSTISVHPRYQNDQLMNGAYRSDLSELILDNPQIQLWTHGHTHEDFDYMIGPTRVVCNPRGYVGYEPRSVIWEPKLVQLS